MKPAEELFKQSVFSGFQYQGAKGLRVYVNMEIKVTALPR
jgi:hypothetical protein